MDDRIAAHSCDNVARSEPDSCRLGEPLTLRLLVDKIEMAKMLGISTRHLDKLRAAGLPVVTLGTAVRFRPLSVDAWLLAQETSETAPEAQGS